VRSAKDTILDVIDRPLDDHLRIEALNCYTGVANPEVPRRLQQFYEKTDADRSGVNGTPL